MMELADLRLEASPLALWRALPLTTAETKGIRRQESAAWAAVHAAFPWLPYPSWSCFCDQLGSPLPSGPTQGYYWVYPTGRVETSPPIGIHTDDRGYLHCEGGPALRIGQWSYYAYRGQMLEPMLFLGQAHPRKALSHPNQEVRAFLLKQAGFARAVQVLNATLLDQDRDGQGERRLYAFPQKGQDDQLVIVSVQTKTKQGAWQSYYLRVPPTVQSCREAVAWTFGQDADTYRIEQES